MSNGIYINIIRITEREKTLFKQLLSKGKWIRPTDRSAVYTEIEPGKTWGIRVTLIDDFAKIEAIQGEKGVWYNAPKRYCAVVMPPNIFEKIRGISFEDKVMLEVENKRKVAAEENGSPDYFQKSSSRN